MLVLRSLLGFLSVGLCWATVARDDRVVVGQTFLAGSADPTGGSTPWSLNTHGVAEKLFTVDANDDIVGQVAESVKKISEFVWEVSLKPSYVFSDGTTVDAEHVAASLTELNQKNRAAQSSLGDINVTAVKDFVVRIESTRVTHVMDAVLAEWVFVIYKRDANGNFVFTGPYVIENLGSDQIDLIPNQYYDQGNRRPPLRIQRFENGDDLADGVKAKEVDIGFHLPVDRLPELRELSGVHVKSFEVGYHYMMFHNIDRLGDVRVRKAIDVAVNRVALAEALQGGNPTRSLFPDYSPYFVDDSNLQGAPEEAMQLLDEAGWIMGSNGIRAKDGVELSITLVAYPHRPGLGIMQPVIAQALRGVGMKVETILTSFDWPETQAIIDARSFDLLMWAQHTLPAGDPLWFMNNFFRTDGGSNYANLASVSVDALLDALSVAEEHPLRVQASGAAMREILDEVPVSNLVTPFWHISLSDRMSSYEPFGSDYHIIHADLFLTEANPNCNQHDLEFIMIEDANLIAVEDTIRSQLEKVGFNVKARIVSKHEFNAAQTSGDFHLSFSETWGAPYDPHSYAAGWVAGDEGHQQAMTNLAPPMTRDRLFNMINAVLVEADSHKRAEEWKAIHEAVHDQAIMLPLWGKRIPAVINNRLTGYVAGSQQFDYPVHLLRVVEGSKTVTIAPGAQTGRFESVGPMNPHAYRPNEFFANNWVYEGLVGYNNQGQVIPALAKSWKIEENGDGERITFTLRQGVKFHDGSEWNCDVAKLNFDNFLAGVLPTPDWHGWFGVPRQLSNWFCTTNGEFVLETREKYYPLLQELSFIRPVRMLSPMSFYEGANTCPPAWALGVGLNCMGISNISGTGPFAYASRTVTDDVAVDAEVVFDRHTDYWGGASDIEHLKIVHYGSSEEVLAAIRNQELDLVWGAGVISGQDIMDIREDEVVSEYLSVFYTGDVQNEILLLNSGKPPLDDIRVRKTIMHAINKVSIGELERGAEIVDNVFPLDAPYSRVNLLPRWDYDVEKAELLNCPVPEDYAAVCNGEDMLRRDSDGNVRICSGSHAQLETFMVMQLDELSEGKYILDCQLIVRNRLHIAPGVTIWATESVHTTDGVHEDIAPMIVIAPSATIQAVGTSTKPITFTSNVDAEWTSPGSTTRGSWGGVAILGNAHVQNGPRPLAHINDVHYGAAHGISNDRSSGELEFVRVWHSGVTFGGVGRGTHVDRLEVAYSRGDGVRVYGGALDLSHVNVIYSGEDGLELDYGFSGKVEYLNVITGASGTYGAAFRATTDAVITHSSFFVGASDETTASVYINGAFNGKLHNINVETEREVHFNFDGCDKSCGEDEQAELDVESDVEVVNVTSNAMYSHVTCWAMVPYVGKTKETFVHRTESNVLVEFDPRPNSGTLGAFHHRGLWLTPWSYLAESGILPSDAATFLPNNHMLYDDLAGKNVVLEGDVEFKADVLIKSGTVLQCDA